MGQRPGFRRGAWLGLGLTFVIATTTPLRAQSEKPAGKAGQPKAAPDEPSGRADESPSAPKPGGLRMSRAVICESIDGYEQYKPLAGAALTSEEKLLVYYRPLRYKVEFVDGYYHAHVTQDNEIRRRGAKKIVRQKRKVVDYEPKSKTGLGQLFMRTMISLKGLEPGDYDLTIILHDELAKDDPASRQVVKFKVVPPDDPRQAGRRRPRRKGAAGMVPAAGLHIRNVNHDRRAATTADQAAGFSSPRSRAFSSKGSWLLAPPNSSSPPCEPATALR